MRKSFIYVLLIAIMPILATSMYAQKKNVLLIMADDFNYWTSKNGYYPQSRTPHIDGLAEKGVFFREAHCSSPVCHPSRNALWSGIRPSTSGIDGNGEPWIRDITGLEDVITMNQYFMQNGYWVYGAGKLYHPGTMGGAETDAQNWSKINSAGTGCSGGSLYQYCNSAKTNYCWSANSSPMSESNCNDYALANDIKELLAGYPTGANADKPFFIGVGVFRPHMPWNSPNHFWELFDYNSLEEPQGYNASQDSPGNDVHQDIVNKGVWMRGIQAYLASCALADSNVGIILDALEKSPYADNTIVLFMGDHGWNLGEKGRWGKFDRCDEANHTTLAIYDPASLGNGQECVKPVSLQDIYPTLIELCNLPKRKNVEGISLKPLLDDPDNPNIHTLALSMYGGVHYIKSEKWRFIDDGASSQLYDNESDPYQWTNLYGQAQYNTVVTDLRFKIDSMIAIGTYIKAHYFDDMPPIAPSGLSGSIVSASKILLNWTDNASNELGFLIMRQVNGSGDFTQLTKLDADVTSYIDNDVNNSSTYAYYVAAYNNADTTESNTITGLQPEDLPPAKPSAFNATPKSASEIELSWMDNALNETDYKVYRQVNNTGEFELLSTLPVNTERYLDGGLSKDNLYAYYIIVSNAIGSESSDTITDVRPTESVYSGIASPYESTPWMIPSTTEVIAWKYDKVGNGSNWDADSGIVIGLYNTNSGGAGQDLRTYGNANCPYEGARWNGGSVAFRENGQWARYTCTFEQSGNYYLKLRGRATSATLQMKVLNPVNLNVEASINVNYPTQCSNQGVYNDNTNWYLCNQHPITVSAGTYVVEVAFPSPDGQGIFGGFTFEKTTATNILEGNNSLLVNSIVIDRYLTIDLTKSNPAAKIEIFDLNGRSVQSMFVGGEEIITIEINPDIPSGVYFVNIDDSDLQVTEKFIIQ